MNKYYSVTIPIEPTVGDVVKATCPCYQYIFVMSCARLVDSSRAGRTLTHCLVVEIILDKKSLNQYGVAKVSAVYQ